MEQEQLIKNMAARGELGNMRSDMDSRSSGI